MILRNTQKNTWSRVRDAKAHFVEGATKSTRTINKIQKGNQNVLDNTNQIRHRGLLKS